MRTLCGFQKYASTFHGYAQSPLFKGALGVFCARDPFIYWDSERSVKGGTFF